MDLLLETRINEAQLAVVGSMLIDERCIGDVLAAVGPDDFPSGPYRTAFSCMRKLFMEGRPVDPVTVLDVVQGQENYADFLRQCMELTPTAANVLEYCAILRRLTRVARISSLAMDLAMVQDLDDAQDLVGKINAQMVEQSGLRIVTAQEIASQFYLRMTSTERPEYITCGIDGIDKKVYLELGDVVGIGASPSVGKTAFALQWAIHLAQKYRVGFFSLETSDSKLGDRLFSNKAHVALPEIKERLAGAEAMARIDKACCEVSELQLEFVPAHGLTVADIVSTALSRRYQVIIVDYLQKVGTGTRKNSTRLDIVSEVSSAFQQAAQKHKILTILLSQLSRPEKVNGKPVPPSMHSFRESGQIEQDLDVALLMYQADPSDYASNRFVKIGKNKDGEKGKVELQFDGRFQRFEEQKVSTYAQLNAIARQARQQSRRGEAYDTNLVDKAQVQMQELTEPDEDLPF